MGSLSGFLRKIFKKASPSISSSKKEKDTAHLYNTRIEEQKKKLKKKPNDVLIRRTLGDLYLAARKIPEALEQFEWIADHYRKGNFIRKALAVQERILRVKPDDEHAAFSLIDLYIKQKMEDEARQICDQLIDKAKKKNDTDKVITLYKKILEFETNNIGIRMTLGDLYMEEGMEGLASMEYLHAVDVVGWEADDKKTEALLLDILKKTRHPRIYIRLALCYIQQDKTKEVVELIDQKNLDVTDNLDFLNQAAQFYLAKGLKNGAEKLINRILHIDPGNLEYLITLGKINLEKGMYAKVYDLFLPVVDKDLKRGRYTEAESLLRLILTQESSHLPTLEKLAHIYEQSRQIPGLLTLYDSLLLIYRSKGMRVKYESTLKRLIELSPDPGPYEEQMEAFIGKPANTTPRRIKRRPVFPNGDETGEANGGLFDQGRETVNEDSGEIEIEIDLSALDKNVENKETLPPKVDKELSDTAIEIFSEDLNGVGDFAGIDQGDLIDVPLEPNDSEMMPAKPDISEEFGDIDALVENMDPTPKTPSLPPPQSDDEGTNPFGKLPTVEHLTSPDMPLLPSSDEWDEAKELSDELLKPYPIPEPELHLELISPEEILESTADEMKIDEAIHEMVQSEPTSSPPPENTPVNAPPVSTRNGAPIDKQEILETPTNDKQVLLGVLENLSSGIALKLILEERQVRTISLIIKYENSRTTTRRLSLKHSVSSAADILPHTEELLKKVKMGDNKVEKITLSVSDFSPRSE